METTCTFRVILSDTKAREMYGAFPPKVVAAAECESQKGSARLLRRMRLERSRGSFEYHGWRSCFIPERLFGTMGETAIQRGETGAGCDVDSKAD